MGAFDGVLEMKSTNSNFAPLKRFSANYQTPQFPVFSNMHSMYKILSVVTQKGHLFPLSAC